MLEYGLLHDNCKISLVISYIYIYEMTLKKMKKKKLPGL